MAMFVNYNHQQVTIPLFPFIAPYNCDLSFSLQVVVQEVALKAFAKSAITSAAPNLAREQFTITNA